MFKKIIFSSALVLLFASIIPIAFSQEAVTATPSPTASVPTLTNTPTATNSVVSECNSMQAPSDSSLGVKISNRSYSSVYVDGPYVAMTFDDGPSATLTPHLLDLLKERGIKATFFVIGENAERHPEILARAVAEGHEIGNHSWSHPQLTKISDERLKEEIGSTSDAIATATGKKPLLFRPPYGAVNTRVRHVIEDQYAMKVIFWSVDPLDWKRPGSAIVSQRILAAAKPGSIILSHDIHSGTVEAMPGTLDALLAKGYHFVTVSELIAMESKTPPPAVERTVEVKKKPKKKAK